MGKGKNGGMERLNHKVASLISRLDYITIPYTVSQLNNVWVKVKQKKTTFLASLFATFFGEVEVVYSRILNIKLSLTIENFDGQNSHAGNIFPLPKIICPGLTSLK